MPTNPTDMSKLEGFDDMLRKFIDKLAPAQRVAGLTPEQLYAALTDEQIAALEALPPEVRAALRRHGTDCDEAT